MFSARELTHSYGGLPLLDRAQLTIQPGERVALIGRNGQGKSTLMKILCGQLAPDEGQFERSTGLTLAYLPQEIPTHLSGRAFDVVLEGLGSIATLEKRYHDTSRALEEKQGDSEALLQELSRLQHELEHAGAWELNRRVELILEKLKIDADQPYEALSGGMKRRVILGRELIKEPTLLMLDEPTNHLDFESIRWLESFLVGLRTALIFVTHDRVFLRKVATRILELDRGKLQSFEGDYDTYLSRKEAQLEAEQHRNAVFDKKLSQEEAWIRQGIKARRTRNEGRVRALHELREQRSQRREQPDQADFAIQQGTLSGRKILTVKNLCYRWDTREIVRDFSTTIWRGDKIGIIGPNGSGKTTLLQLLLGKLQPQSGEVLRGTNLDVVYFDQHREQLDPEQSLKQVVAADDEFVHIGEQKRHIYSYLGDFLFTPEQARGKVSALSGGERNRLLLAKLFTRQANVLVMDEPTNDLDLETLELLEDLLFDYPATLLLVSHDRQFLNRVVTQTFALEANGVVRETIGGYDEYERQTLRNDAALTKRSVSKPKSEDVRKSDKPRYRTNREQWELDDIPGKIEALEAKQQEWIHSMAQPDFGSDPKQIRCAQQELDQIEAQLMQLMQRWEELEAIPANPNKTVPRPKPRS
ncbi:MAG: ATP-binding cassette domain-containing protein [Puniceicoccaceae bacterium]